MKSLWTYIAGLYLLLSSCSAARPSRRATDSLHSHHHSDSDLDVVQCHNAVYKISENSGRPELAIGEETRADPSRQYLPPPGLSSPPKQEEDPAASFNQPNFLSVENTFVSPTLQNNYNSLFAKKNNPEPSPAAQNVVTNTLNPPTPRTNSIEKLSDEEKYSLDRLCNDAFHSFLCKPIKGPRKTPNGRIRPNAILPPDVIAGLSSFHDETRIRPDPTKAPSTTAKPNPANFYPQPSPFSNKLTTNNVFTTLPPTTLPATIPKYKPDVPEIPSPTNNNPQFLRPQPSNERPLISAAQKNGYFYEKPKIPFPPQIGNPSNQNSQFVYQRPSTTPRPTSTSGYSYDKPKIPFPSQIGNPSNPNSQIVYQRPSTTPRPTSTSGYSYDKPNIPFPSNNVPQIALPSQSIHSKAVPHQDCDKQRPVISPELANPSNDYPSFIKPFPPTTPKPLFTPKQVDNNPLVPFPNNNVPRFSLFPQITTTVAPNTEECDKNKSFHPPNLLGNPTNQNSIFLRPENTIPSFQFPNSFMSKTTFSQTTTQKTTKTDECDKHKQHLNPIIGNPTNQNPTVVKPFYHNPYSPFPSNTLPSVILPSKTTPKPTEECDKHKSPINPIFGSPTNQHPTHIKPYNEKKPSPHSANIFARPSSITNPTTRPTTECDKNKQHFQPEFAAPTNQEVVVSRPSYQPVKNINSKIPSPSNNIAQILAQPQQLKPVAFYPEKNDGYFYEKPAIPFPPPEGYPSNGNPSIAGKPTQKPFTFPTTTSPNQPNGYVYDRPSIPFASNNIAQIISQLPELSTKEQTTPKTPCVHDKPTASVPVIGNPSNQFSVSSRPSNSYLFEKTKTSFSSESARPTNQIPSAFRLSNNQPFATNIQSSRASPSDFKPNLESKPQNQVEVTIAPGYSYDKPDTPFDQSPSNNGYSYPRPSNPFIR